MKDDKISAEEIQSYFGEGAEWHKGEGREASYLAYCFDDVEVRMYTDLDGTMMLTDAGVLVMLNGTAEMIGLRERTMDNNRFISLDMLAEPEWQAVSHYAWHLRMPLADFSDKDMTIEIQGDNAYLIYKEEMTGDIYNLGVIGDENQKVGTVLVPAKEIFPFITGEKITREQLLEYWPACYSWNFYDRFFYCFIFENELCVYVYSDEEGNVGSDSMLLIKYYN